VAATLARVASGPSGLIPLPRGHISTQPGHPARPPSCPTQGALPNYKNAEADHDREALGRSRGGLTTKVHLAADRRCRPVARVVTAGQRNDAVVFDAVMGRVHVLRRGRGRPRTRPGRVLADKAYSSRAIRGSLRRRGIHATIPEPADQQANRARRGPRGGRPPTFDSLRYKDRNVVERCINKLKAFRAVASRYDKREYMFGGTVDVASIRIWLRDPVT
jgi:transposase